MIIESTRRLGFVVCCFFLIAGCAAQPQKAAEDKSAVGPAPCIVVMPVVAAADDDVPVTPQGRQALLHGSQVLNGLLKEALAGRGKVHFVDEQDVNMGSPSLEKSRRIAEKYQCNVVLDLTLSRYEERVGGEYGVKQPAAVTFAYRLYETGDGTMLCHGRFDERQQALMENLLSLPKAKNRGLTWLTAEQLARDGLREQFDACPALGGTDR